jgi:hypothetical protein
MVRAVDSDRTLRSPSMARHTFTTAVGGLLLLCVLVGCEADAPSADQAKAGVPAASAAAPAKAAVVPKKVTPAATKAAVAAPQAVVAAPRAVAKSAVAVPRAVATKPAALVAPAAKSYANCDALNADYSGGVAMPGAVDHRSSGTAKYTPTYSSALYNANTARDRDKDHIACEQ